jgi:hypothetical protein
MAPGSIQEYIDSIFKRVDMLPHSVRSELLESIGIMQGPAYEILRERHQLDQSPMRMYHPGFDGPDPSLRLPRLIIE